MVFFYHLITKLYLYCLYWSFGILLKWKLKKNRPKILTKENISTFPNEKNLPFLENRYRTGQFIESGVFILLPYVQQTLKYGWVHEFLFIELLIKCNFLIWQFLGLVPFLFLILSFIDGVMSLSILFKRFFSLILRLVQHHDLM